LEAAVENNQEDVNATDLESNPEEKEAVAEHKEVPKEKTALKIIGALEDRYGDRHLAVGRRRQQKERTKAMVSPGRSLHRARDTVVTDQARNVAQGTPKGRTFGKRRPARPECNNGIRNRDLRQQLRLASKGNVNETFRETLGLEIAKRRAKSSVRTTTCSKSIDVGSSTTPATFACTNRKKMVVHVNRLAPYQGTARDEQP
jgi:hypothetical protein